MLLDSGISMPQPLSTNVSGVPLPDVRSRTIRPLGAYMLSGVAWSGSHLLAIDTLQGYLLEINPANDGATILNPNHVSEFVGATGLAVWGNQIWFARDNNVYFCTADDPTPQHFVTLPYTVTGVGVWESTVYIACPKSGYISIVERETGRSITRLPTPGVGDENLTLRGEELWVCDRTEQTVYCLDRATGELQFSVLTPFEFPTGLTFAKTPDGDDLLYVCYAGEEPYIRDNPNAEMPYELTFRDRTFIHPLHFRYYPDKRYAVSNGYLIEMVYLEELVPLEEVLLEKLEWRIALPAETDRQTIRQVEAIGLPFSEEIQEGQRVAVFKFDSLKPNERRLFGWKVLLEVRGIRYLLTPREVEKAPTLSPDFKQLYLQDDDELAMETDVIRTAATEAIGSETNLLRKILKIRNYVYDRLSYGIKPHIDTPDVVLERGVGSCGEYVGVLLALARLNGIACRTVGRYKCPAHADRHNIPLLPDYNHVWIEFYIPGFGWLPMESNPDDIVERGPYPTRFFMGLPWYHAEISKGIPFETIRTENDALDVSIGELAINHVRFTILGELPPP